MACGANRSVATEQDTITHVALGQLDFKLKKVFTCSDGSSQYRILGPARRNLGIIYTENGTDNDLKKKILMAIRTRFLNRNQFSYVPYEEQKDGVNADYGVFEQWITGTLGGKKEDLGDGYFLYRGNTKRQKMIICKQDDRGIAFMFNNNKWQIESECFTKLDKASKDFIFNYGKERAANRGKKCFPLPYTEIWKGDQYSTLYRNEQGRFEIKSHPVDGWTFNGNDYFYCDGHKGAYRDYRLTFGRKLKDIPFARWIKKDWDVNCWNNHNGVTYSYGWHFY
jgi:hypothetical protein